jgi:hypothetical protein
MSETDQYTCRVCRDTGMVQCAEQDGTGMYEQACPEKVHDEGDGRDDEPGERGWSEYHREEFALERPEEPW